MRFITTLALLLTVTLGLPAAAQVRALPPATPQPPAKTTAGAIIPGSPLAALTKAATQSDSDTNTPAPFGTNDFGLSATGTLGAEAAQTLGDFASAIQQSMRLTPVLNWLESIPASPIRRQHLADIALALLMTILPGLAVDAGLRIGLTWPRTRLIRRAAKHPDTEPPEDNARQGLAAAEAGETEKRPRRHMSLFAWCRRCAFSLLHYGLTLVPLFGFALTIQMLISSGLITTRSAHFAVIGVANAYLLCRVLQETLRLPLAPGAASLRLVSMSDDHASRVIGWTGLLLVTGFFGYAFVSLSELLGLSQDGATVLSRLIALAIDIEIAVAIWRSRHLVAHWIAGPPNSESPFAGFRRRLSRVWHFLGLFYILSLWAALAGGVHNAFGVLLRVVLVVVAAVVIGRLAWTSARTLLERNFPDAFIDATLHPALHARAHAYTPLIRMLIHILVGILVIIGILQGWGIDALGWLLTNPFSSSLISTFVSIVVTIGVAIIIWEGANYFLNSQIDRLSHSGHTRQASRLHTLLPMLKATIGVSISLVAGVICLSKIGVNVAPLLAGAGVLGIAIGFGSQKLVQDIITGLFLLLEDAMQVGDVISLAGMSGTVERLSIRTIRLRGSDGSVNIIPFSAVTTVTNMTRDFGYAQISIEVDYAEDLARVYAVLTDIAHTMRKDHHWGKMMRDDLKIFGLDQFGASALTITGQIRTGPGQHWAVRREFYGRVKTRFALEGIALSHDQQVFTIEPAALKGALATASTSARPPAPAAARPNGAPE